MIEFAGECYGRVGKFSILLEPRFSATDPLIQAVSGRLVSSPQAQSTQLNRVAYQICTHLSLSFKTHVGNTYPSTSPQKILERPRVLYGKLFP